MVKASSFVPSRRNTPTVTRIIAYNPTSVSSPVSELRVALVLVCTAIGCGFIFLAAVGVVRMPDLYSRMQASGKGATVGAIVTVLGAAIHFGVAPIIIRGG